VVLVVVKVQKNWTIVLDYGEKMNYSYHSHNRFLKSLKSFQKCCEEKDNAIECLLKRMYEIGVSEGVLPRLSKKRLESVTFSYQHGGHMDAAFDDCDLYLTDFSIDFGDICIESIPLDWLWRKAWEKEFIRDYVIPVKEEMDKIADKQKSRELLELSRLKKKYEK